MKLLKKIAPLAVTGLFLGMTAGFAVAADLSTWNSDFSNPAIVVSSSPNAGAEDIMAALDIATLFGTTTAATADTVTGEAEKIEASGNPLNINETFANVETGGFDDDELPLMLADGTYKAHDGGSFDYKQRIKFGASYPLATFKRDTDYKNEPALMVYGKKKGEFVNYTLTFTTSAKSTNTSNTLDDFEDSEIELLGNEYTIVNAEVSGTQITLDLMTGPITDTIQEGETKTYTIDDTTYEVTLQIVDNDGNVVFIINGETTDELAKGGTYKLEDDTEIGIAETTYQSWAGGIRQAKFYLGSQKLSLVDSDYSAYGTSESIKLNEDYVDGLYHDITAIWDGTDLGITKITFYWKPADDLFAGEGEYALLPGLESLKVTFEGLTTAYEEEIKIEPNGADKIQITVPLETRTQTFDILYANGTGFLGVGEEATEKLMTNSTASGVVFDEDAHQYFIATKGDPAYESYLMEAKVHKSGTTTYVDFRDVGETNWNCIDLTATGNNVCTVGSVTITVSAIDDTENTVTFTVDDKMDVIYTKEGMEIWLPVENSSYDAKGYRTIYTGGNETTYYLDVWEEAPVTEVKHNKQFNVTLTMSGTAGTRETNVYSVPNTEAKGVVGYGRIGTTDVYVAYSVFGTHWEHNRPSGGNYDTTIIYPGEQAEASCYVAEETASIVSGTGTATEAGWDKILDTDEASLEGRNVIAIGGSAINQVSATLLGLDYPTYGTDQAWIDATGVDALGKGIIKIIDDPAVGNIAMIVAGYEGSDTEMLGIILKEGHTGLTGTSKVFNTVTKVVVE